MTWRMDIEHPFSVTMVRNEPNDAPDVWLEATARTDGCIHLRKYSNAPRGEVGSDDDYMHICDLKAHILDLIALHEALVAHYGKDWR